MAADSAIDERGKRLHWQCGCRQHGGVMVQQWKPSDPDIDNLIRVVNMICGTKGCECDSHNGHTCALCVVRRKLREALETR